MAGTGTATLNAPLLTCEASSVRLRLEASFAGRGAPDRNQAGLLFFFSPFLLFQRIAAADLRPGLMYFGCSIHGQLDMNEDGLVDLAVGSLGNAVLLWLAASHLALPLPQFHCNLLTFPGEK